MEDGMEPLSSVALICKLVKAVRLPIVEGNVPAIDIYVSIHLYKYKYNSDNVLTC